MNIWPAVAMAVEAAVPTLVLHAGMRASRPPSWLPCTNTLSVCGRGTSSWRDGWLKDVHTVGNGRRGNRTFVCSSHTLGGTFPFPLLTCTNALSLHTHPSCSNGAAVPLFMLGLQSHDPCGESEKAC